MGLKTQLFAPKIVILAHFGCKNCKTRRNFFLGAEYDQKWSSASFDPKKSIFGPETRKLEPNYDFRCRGGFEAKNHQILGVEISNRRFSAEELKNPENLICELGKIFKTK